MSEELVQKGLTQSGLKIGNYEFYNIGNSTLNQLKIFNIIPNRDYKKYGSRKPDGLLVDRRNKNNIRTICVIEHKEAGKFRSNADKKRAIQKCNELCQVLEADVGIVTDNSSFIWFNPRHASAGNEYFDTIGTSRSYSIIKDENSHDFVKPFIIDQMQDEHDITKLNSKTRIALQNLEVVRKNISPRASEFVKEVITDPTNLAKQIWQDVWSVTSKDAEKCLYTFIELFIFKYLSDLGILDEDDKGNKVNFKYIYSLNRDKAFKNYAENVRPCLKIMFPPDADDKTTIINGTVLNPNVPEHGKVFYKILGRFNSFGELRNIDPSFKSKVFEEFMKETISRKNMGQFFTPRKIINSMIEISDIDRLPEGSEICDPACGVGGFILEPMKVKRNGVNFYYPIEDGKIRPRYRFYGFDKGLEKETELTIILAKANMLIFLSEIIKKNPTLLEELAHIFNSTFKLLSNTGLGTLSRINPDRYDLILTNPPYVVSGVTNHKETIKENSKLREFYKIYGMGVEGLFLEWIVRCLKPSRKAFVIIPDGILNRLHDTKLREFVKDECIIDAIISLPINAFYRNPKKTYILALTKKPEKTQIERKEHIQLEPIFTYLVSEIGETRDVNRFPIEDENDLIEMVSLFNQFKGAKETFTTNSKRCKIQPVDTLSQEVTRHWSVDKWWNRQEKIALGIEEQNTIMTLDEFKEEVIEIQHKIQNIYEQLNAL